MEIKCDDMAYLSKLPNLITAAKVYTQALIHSNLFNTHLTQHGELDDLTLSQMAFKKSNKPFVCAIIEGNFMFFSCYLYVFYMYFTCYLYVFYMYYLYTS